MGYIKHHAIIVTSSRDDVLERVREGAKGLGASVSPVGGEQTNGYRSFLVEPDGSKEGWDASFEGDMRRDAIVALLDAQRYEGGSSPLEWVEVSYGSDDRTARVERHAWYETPVKERSP